MSISRTVYLQRSRVLAPKEWADAIRAAGFAMDMDSDFEVESFSGYLPCTYEGKPAGFEYLFADLAEIEFDDEARSAIGDRDIGISFVTHSDMLELVTAVVAAAVLCAKADGVVHDEDAGEFIAADDSIANAKELLASVRADLV